MSQREQPTENFPAWKAEVAQYEPKRPALELVEAFGWALWFIALMPAWIVVGVLERVGFGPWLRSKLGTEK